MSFVSNYPFTAEAQLVCSLPANVIGQICEHLEEHRAQVRVQAGRGEAVFDKGSIRLWEDGGRFALKVMAATSGDLLALREVAASHFIEFSKRPAEELIWSGHGIDAVHPSFFRLMTVKRARMVAPRMRRVTLTGQDLARYSSNADLHVKLLFPPISSAPLWPELMPSGLVRWPEGPNKPAVRKYTIRRIDVATGEIDVDFVLHDDPGPGSKFGASASSGDRVGMIGPGGRSVPAASYYLLLGDETAIPAIGRIMDTLSGSQRGLALIEVDSPADEVPLSSKAGLEVRWIHRDAGASLASAVQELDLPDQAGTFVWAGAEFETFRDLRRFFRRGCKIPPAQQLIVSYWRKGAEAA
ncbi:siderophore-interacting protein [Terrihabitans rhizophilus]|uniref:Siderophore-interacting protein n=1 Tax=Terrihabitans rhizophilus TaxID=3092662 RepID=A0ABU4RS15_9HYPH|nr:siderophore-interacting protein [Terrihabitans sp. PJ23]MDX6806943.1 siderophore-interacting protein [Terrihabitans sp. PJ23]